MPQPLELWALHPYPFDIGVPPGGRSSIKAVEKVQPHKSALMLDFRVQKMPSKDKKGNPFRQPCPNHYILQVKVDLLIYYRRKDKGQDMAGETLGYHSWQNISPAALDSWPKYEVIDHLTTIFQM